MRRSETTPQVFSNKCANSDYKTTFSAQKFLKGFYNQKEGDIYVLSNYNIRGDHSAVAARMTNYYAHCYNPAFVEENKIREKQYLEIPNGHSSIYHENYILPSPLTNREGISNVLWKRLSENSIIVCYHPLTSHPLVEDKDGASVIRGALQGEPRIYFTVTATTYSDSSQPYIMSQSVRTACLKSTMGFTLTLEGSCRSSSSTVS